MSHPGLLLDDGADATPLTSIPPLTVAEAAGLAAGLAATLADLHDLGVQLGGFDAADVLLDGEGRPRLRVAHLAHDDEAAARVADVRSLGSLLAGWLPETGEPAAPSRRWRPMARRSPAARQSLTLASTAKRAMAATTAGPRARQIADAIAIHVPDARLPLIGNRTAALPDGPLSPSRRTRSVGLRTWTVVGAVVLIAVVLVVHQRHQPATTRPAASPAAPTCPQVTSPLRADLDTDGCDDALTFDGGVLSSPVGRFRVGAPGDRAATGKWNCDAPATLALLQPDGSIFAADSWAAPGQGVVLRLVGTVAGAVDISAADADGDGCDEVTVRRADGGTTTLRPSKEAT